VAAKDSEELVLDIRVYERLEGKVSTIAYFTAVAAPKIGERLILTGEPTPWPAFIVVDVVWFLEPANPAASSKRRLESVAVVVERQ